MKPIAIFYHCVYCLGEPPVLLPSALGIIKEQMGALESSGLLASASYFLVGINGDEEACELAKFSIPQKADIILHGLKSRAENLTIVEIEKWVPSHPGYDVLYFHSKGATHPPDSAYGNNVSAPWRRGMTADLIANWRTCVGDLSRGYDVACSHFMRHMADGTQNIAAGNFWWATSDFLAKLPSIYLRERIKNSGIAALESRYESEVWIGNGPMPNVKEYRPGGGGGVP